MRSKGGKRKRNQARQGHRNRRRAARESIRQQFGRACPLPKQQAGFYRGL